MLYAATLLVSYSFLPFLRFKSSAPLDLVWIDEATSSQIVPRWLTTCTWIIISACNQLSTLLHIHVSVSLSFRCNCERWFGYCASPYLLVCYIVSAFKWELILWQVTHDVWLKCR